MVFVSESIKCFYLIKALIGILEFFTDALDVRVNGAVVNIDVFTISSSDELVARFNMAWFINEGFDHAWAQVLPETPQWNIRNVLAANNPISFVSDLWREFPIEIGFLGIGTRDKGEGHRGRMEGRGTNPYTSTPLGNLVGVHVD